jgi:glucose/arabinose dehydrogenase
MTSDSRLRLAVAGLIAAAVAAAAAIAGGGERAEAQSTGLALQRVGNFNRPVQVTHAPNRPKLVFVVEQRGTIRVLRGGRTLPRPLLNIQRFVHYNRGEAGLLSVAFHPAYPRNRSFFVFYSNNDGNIQVDRFRSRRGQPARANRGSRRTVIEIPHPSNRHFGGQLRLGPGGFLYLTTGDGSRGGDAEENAQDKRSLLGKLLRIIPRPRGGHRSPPTNPFVGERGHNQIFSLGLRNPWGFAFDRRTGDIWIADVGERRWEEVNHVTRGEARGANFGWSCREGPEAFQGAPEACAAVPPTEFTDPVYFYPIFDDHPGCAVIGGHVARGRGAPARLRGRYLYGDYCTGEIRSFRPANPGQTDAATGVGVGFGLSSLDEGPRGRLYAATTEGTVHRIVSR